MLVRSCFLPLLHRLWPCVQTWIPTVAISSSWESMTPVATLLEHCRLISPAPFLCPYEWSQAAAPVQKPRATDGACCVISLRMLDSNWHRLVLRSPYRVAGT